MNRQTHTQLHTRTTERLIPLWPILPINNLILYQFRTINLGKTNTKIYCRHMCVHCTHEEVLCNKFPFKYDDALAVCYETSSYGKYRS